MNCSPSLTDADDRRHELSDSPIDRESLIFVIILPEEDLGVIAYTWVDGQHQAASMGLVFGRDDERFAQFHVDGAQVDPAADFDDWTVGPLTVRHGEPHEDARVSFEHEDVSLDFTFEATTPAFSYHDNPGGCPSWLATNRLEQSGKVLGRIKIGDRIVDFDTTGHRDHSWGSRDWTAIHHYKWVNVQAGSDIAINFMHGMAVDQLYELGYVDRDGAQSAITSISTRMERDPHYFSYTSADFTLVDELGRTTTIEGGPRTAHVVWPAGGLESHDAGGPCTVDGVPAVMHVEEGWHPQFVERRRALLGPDLTIEAARQTLAVNKSVGALTSS